MVYVFALVQNFNIPRRKLWSFVVINELMWSNVFCGSSLHSSTDTQSIFILDTVFVSPRVCKFEISDRFWIRYALLYGNVLQKGKEWNCITTSYNQKIQ